MISFSSISVEVNKEYIKFKDGDFVRKIFLYEVFDGGEVVIDENFSNGDDNYDFYLRFSPDDLYLDILVKKNGDGVLVLPSVYEFYQAFSRFCCYFNPLLDRLIDISNFINGIDGFIEDGFDSLHTQINGLSSQIDDKLGDVNCDFTPVIEKLEEVDSEIKEFDGKLDLLKIAKIPELIDEKISNVFALKSLNGSNGAKFKDGEIVSVKGYSGSWEVVGSYFTLTSDNVVTVIYQVKQSDRVMLVPSAYVFKDE